MEVALAATVLALTLTGMVQVIQSGSEMLDVSRKQTIAAQILHDEIEQVRLQSWSYVSGTIPNTLTTIPPNSPLAISALFASVGGNFTCQYEAAQVNDIAGNPISMMQVTFKVTWTGITGHSYSRWATTLVSQNGLSVAYQRS